MKSQIQRLVRGFDHLHKGTLLDRLKHELRQRTREQRMAEWNSRASRLESVTMHIQRGVRMKLYPDSNLSKKIYRGDFEWRERKFLNCFLRPGDVFVDAGANVGFFSMIAAHLVGPAGQVYSFEPAAQTYGRLMENARLNGFDNIRGAKLALSDQRGSLEMNISSIGSDAQNSLAPIDSYMPCTTETVDCIRWDDFAAEQQLVGKVAMMKIDVEGWETRMLGGGRQFFTRNDAPLLQVEFNDRLCEIAGSSCQELYDLLRSFGYQIYRYDVSANRLLPETLQDKYAWANLIAAKSAELVNARLKRPAWMNLLYE